MNYLDEILKENGKTYLSQAAAADSLATGGGGCRDRDRRRWRSRACLAVATAALHMQGHAHRKLCICLLYRVRVLEILNGLVILFDLLSSVRFCSESSILFRRGFPLFSPVFRVLRWNGDFVLSYLVLRTKSDTHHM